MSLPETSISPPDWLRYRPDGRLIIPSEPGDLFALGHLIRGLEANLLSLYDTGKLSGTVHTCIGQELAALYILHALDHREDYVFSTHRNHGHFIAYGGRLESLYGEIMGKVNGACRGVGGSQHVACLNFHSSGIQGGMTGIATGVAHTLKQANKGAVSAVFIGDGTLGEGLVYESMNLASIWKVPVLFIVECNGVAQSTETSGTMSGSIKARAAAFDLDFLEVTDTDSDSIERIKSFVELRRASASPGVLSIRTRRLGPHSKGDDPRDASHIQSLWQIDPLSALRSGLDPEQVRMIENDNRTYVGAVTAFCLAAPDAEHVEGDGGLTLQRAAGANGSYEAFESRSTTWGANLNSALHRLIASHAEVLLLGEDLHDPYGGAFKVSRGVSTAFPDRVLSTPISEAGIVGAAIGMALSGRRPVVEIMFSDFLSLTLDQIANHAAKIPLIYPDGRCPLVVRSPSGGNRGYGPTHSQSLEYVYQGVPGLLILAPSHRHDPGLLLEKALLEMNCPCLFVEHKLLYGMKADIGKYRALNPEGENPFPTLWLATDKPADITIVSYGGMLSTAEAAAQKLEEEELTVEILAPAQLSPLPVGLIEHLVGCRAVLIVSETPAGAGFGVHLAARLLTQGFSGTCRIVGAHFGVIPAARGAEKAALPQVEHIVLAAESMILSA